jgi:hypothetical protein
VQGMVDTYTFQASFLGDLSEDYHKMRDEVDEHIKEASGIHSNHRKALERHEERITRRRKELDSLQGLVSDIFL